MPKSAIYIELYDDVRRIINLGKSIWKDIKDSTKGVKQPGFRQLSDTMVPIVAQFQMDDALLTVYCNGFVLYIRNDIYSVFAAVHMNGMLYRFADKNSFIPVEEYMDYQWNIYMPLIAENRLEPNYARYLRSTEQTIADSYTQVCVMSYTSDIVEKIAPTDFKMMEHKRLQEALQKLTFKQRQVIKHYYFLNKN
ncbi:hypothetical protein ABE854_02640 [Enterococcus faecium]|uniref:hypothetical protein n=1 Tax=Enterococcus faecium TaxID=1352 RepID=UPI003D6B2AD0